jgi:hypothetical protein
MAPKNESSAGEMGELREQVDAGESMSGDTDPDNRDCVEPAVLVRIGGGW